VGGDELSDIARDELLQLYRQRLDAFRARRGEEGVRPPQPPLQAARRLDQVLGADPCPRCSRLLPDKTASAS
jgi:hypothetical protein